MREEDANQLRRLIPPLLELLTDAAAGTRVPAETAAAYLHLHREVRRILSAYGEECICPWPNVWGWVGSAAQQADWQQFLADRARKARLLCGLEEPPPWTLEDYFRDGDPGDVPFWDEFSARLAPHKQVILDKSLTRELAHLGTAVLSDWTKGHLMECSGKRGSRSSVPMYKIRQGSPFGEVVLRVFFATASGYRLVLLHGYDKGDDVSDSRERREADVACQRLADILRQRSAGVARP